MAVLEHLVGALNIFAKAIAPNSRVQICKLGENIMTGLLYLWNNYPSDALKVPALALRSFSYLVSLFSVYH